MEEVLFGFFKDKLDLIRNNGVSIENIKQLFYERQDSIPESPSLQSSAHGKIKLLLTTQGKAAKPDCNFLHQVTNIKFCEHKVLTITSKRCEENEKITWLRNSGQRNDLWIQDLILVMINKKLQNRILIEGLQSKNFGKTISNFTEVNELFQINKLPFDLPGGDILSGDKFIFIGKPTFERNCAIYRKNTILKEGILQFSNNLIGLQRDFCDAFLFLLNYILDDSKVLIVFEEPNLSGFKNTSFPFKIFEHLDIFLTLGGPISDNQYLLFLGKPILISEYPKEGINKPFLDIATVWWEKTKEWLETIQTGFGERRFKVVQIPLPCVLNNNEGKLKWHFYSYNNCLIEIFENEKNAAIPAYYHKDKDHPLFGIYEKEIFKTFKKCGFKNVNRIDGLRAAIESGKGSLRCITKDLIRI